jgi:hypothetical protein
MFIAFFVGTFVVVEGGASAVMLVYDAVANPRGPASKKYSTYDPTLGWVNLPGFRDDNLYGPGIGVSINAQSFRHDREVPRSVGDERVRILCSGDSFTFGIGVDGDSTWCRGLEQLEGVETVNIGHAGYGLDQTSLFHERVAQQLQYRFHVMAFIANDFRRMRLRRFLGYDKPFLRLQDGTLVVENVPVPQPNRWLHWMVLNDQLFDLRSVEFGRRLFNGTRPIDRQALTPEEGRLTAMAVFRSVAERDRANGSQTLFVLLPEDTREPLSAEEWGELLSNRLEAMGLPFLDLSREFRKLPLTIRRPMMDAQWGHYSVEGHAWVATQLRDRLRRFPLLAAGAAASTSTGEDAR